MTASPAGLHVTGADGATAVWSYAELRVMRGMRAGEPVQIERAVSAVEVVVVGDRALLAQLEAHRPAGTRLAVSGGRVRGRTLLVALLLVVLAGVALYRFGLPVLADAAADRVPAAWERELGDAVVADFAPESARERAPRIVAPATALHARLAAVAAGAATGSRLVVARQDVVNAFAAPGGTVVVTTGLLRALRTPDELAAVLAHELGHVRRRHPMHGMMRQLSLQALLGVLAGDASLWSGGLQVAGQLGGLR
ncbi:MAG: M48 family metallopeptidase, partial [Candidatus Eisenbacteria bacterium]